MIPLLLPG